MLDIDKQHNFNGERMTGSNNDANSTERIIELHLPSRLGYEKVAMDTAASLAQRMGFGEDRIQALRTALAEAVTNAIEHGNAHDEASRVSVAITLRADALAVCVSDQGQKSLSLDQTQHTPHIEEALSKADKGGWGLWLIRELMDEVEFSTAPDGGNQIRMVLRLVQHHRYE